MDLDKIAPLERFTGRAQAYERARPGYPAEALNFVLKHCGLKNGSILIDVGCGTGISSRAFAKLDLQVIGIEPNDDMLAMACAANIGLDYQAPTYQAGKAESTGLSDAYADAVLSAQTFHWFEPETTLLEFRRILKNKGRVILIWNEHDQLDPYTRQYSDLILSLPGAVEIQALRNRAGGPLLASKLFQHGERFVFRNEQNLDEQGLIERAFSDSCAPTETKAVERFTKAVQDIFKAHQQSGKIILRYQTTVYVAQKG